MRRPADDHVRRIIGEALEHLVLTKIVADLDRRICRGAMHDQQLGAVDEGHTQLVGETPELLEDQVAKSPSGVAESIDLGALRWRRRLEVVGVHLDERSIAEPSHTPGFDRHESAPGL